MFINILKKNPCEKQVKFHSFNRLIDNVPTDDFTIRSRFDPSKKNTRPLFARANQRPERRRLIKIARTRFRSIAAAAVGRFSTIQPTSLCPSLSLSSRSFLCIPRLTAPARRPPSSISSHRPRGPCPFRTTQTRGAIRRGLRARHSDDRIRTTRGMSNNIRAATVTDDEAAARNSAARFAFFFPSSSRPPSCPRDML